MMSGATVQHTPAWKRLGLKLKDAKGDPVPPNAPVSGLRSQGTKHSQNGGSFSKEPPRKKHRINSSAGTAIPNPTQTITSPKSSNERPKLKKKVSFTADTKAMDGDTARPAIPANLLPLANSSITIDETATSKPPKKSNTKSGPSKQPPSKPQAGLSYLKQFYHDHSNWKFSKNREVWILKHAFSESMIPSDNNFPMAVYLHNLNSTAARQRLKDECVKARSAEKPELNGSVDETKRQAFLSQVKLFHVKPAGFVEGPEFEWAQEQKRIDVIWWILNPGSASVLAISEDDTKAVPASGAALLQPTPTRRERKAKRRTFDMDMSSSSSSSSSSESESSVLDESSSEDEDDTSSSGSSSNSDEVS